jgi:hypothetical protein
MIARRITVPQDFIVGALRSNNDHSSADVATAATIAALSTPLVTERAPPPP